MMIHDVVTQTIVLIYDATSLCCKYRGKVAECLVAMQDKEDDDAVDILKRAKVERTFQVIQKALLSLLTAVVY